MAELSTSRMEQVLSEGGVIGVPRPRKKPVSMGYGEHGVYGVGRQLPPGLAGGRKVVSEGGAT